MLFRRFGTLWGRRDPLVQLEDLSVQALSGNQIQDFYSRKFQGNSKIRGKKRRSGRRLLVREHSRWEELGMPEHLYNLFDFFFTGFFKQRQYASQNDIGVMISQDIFKAIIKQSKKPVPPGSKALQKQVFTIVWLYYAGIIHEKETRRAFQFDVYSEDYGYSFWLGSYARDGGARVNELTALARFIGKIQL